MKKISIVGHFTGVNSFGISKPYMDFFSHFGEVSVISPWEKEIRDTDLLVLPGGPDVDVFRYLGEDDDIDIMTGAPCMIRERFDKMLLPKYIANRTPIWGTCRGHQSLAVFFGAKLKQDMYHESNGEDRRKEVHDVVPTEAGLLIPGLTGEIFGVNSIHHQTVLDCPANAQVLAWYKPNNPKKKEYVEEIEALTYFPHYPAHSSQWHVEEIYDKFSVTLIRHLLSLSDEEAI